MKNSNGKTEQDSEENRARLCALFDTSYNILKTANGAIKLRCKRLVKSLTEKEEKIRNFETRHACFKDAVITYHKNHIEKNKGEEHAFLTALEKYNVNDSTFDEIFDKQMLNCKRQRIEEVVSKVTNDKENIYQQGNESLVGISPMFNLKRNTNDVSFNMSSKPGYKSILNQSGMTSPISSMNSSTFSPKQMIKDGFNSRFRLNHTFHQDIIIKKHCNNCCQRDNKTPMHKCIQCSAYVHDGCRKLRLCLSLNKIPLKITSEKSLSLNKLCGNTSLPMVPNLFLVIMDHIQTFGLSTTNIYTCECKEKEVKDLCNNLFDGNLKYLIKSDITIIANVFLMLLKNLRDPLLPNNIISKLKCYIDINDSVNWNGIATSLNDLSKEAKDTVTYILIHLKVISNSVYCNLNSKKLANIFTPLLVETGYITDKTIQVINMLIDLDIIFYDNYFINETDFFGSYFNELRRKDVSKS